MPYVWFAAYEDYLEEDLERAFREKRFALANNAFDVGLKDVCDRLKVWRPDVDDPRGVGSPVDGARDETFTGKEQNFNEECDRWE